MAKKQSIKNNAPKRKTKNGILETVPGTIASELWSVFDKLKTKLGRAPARFEAIGAVEKLKKTYNRENLSLQFFKWRKFNGIAGRASGKYPTQNTFEASAATAERENPKPAKKTAKKVTKKVAKKTGIIKGGKVTIPKKSAVKKVAKKSTAKKKAVVKQTELKLTAPKKAAKKAVKKVAKKAAKKTAPKKK